MTAVSLQCKIRNHHPEWSNVSFTGPVPLGWFRMSNDTRGLVIMSVSV